MRAKPGTGRADWAASRVDRMIDCMVVVVVMIYRFGVTGLWNTEYRAEDFGDDRVTMRLNVYTRKVPAVMELDVDGARIELQTTI